jgi:hypothetical protein
MTWSVVAQPPTSKGAIKNAAMQTLTTPNFISLYSFSDRKFAVNRHCAFLPVPPSIRGSGGTPPTRNGNIPTSRRCERAPYRNADRIDSDNRDTAMNGRTRSGEDVPADLVGRVTTPTQDPAELVEELAGRGSERVYEEPHHLVPTRHHWGRRLACCGSRRVRHHGRRAVAVIPPLGPNAEESASRSLFATQVRVFCAYSRRTTRQNEGVEQ